MDPEESERQTFNEAFTSRNVPATQSILGASVVGILGAGGLGSNVAVALCRAGIGKLIVADPDRVEVSNLNRQHYFLDQVGRLKVEALADTLFRINPYLDLEVHALRVTPAEIPGIYSEARLLVEALDLASEKAWLIEAWMVQYPERALIAASGLAGYGDGESLKIERRGRLLLCGDGKSDFTRGLCATRVGWVAHMEANLAVEVLMEEA